MAILTLEHALQSADGFLSQSQREVWKSFLTLTAAFSKWPSHCTDDYFLVPLVFLSVSHSLLHYSMAHH